MASAGALRARASRVRAALPLRAAGSFAAGLLGLLLVAALFGSSSWSWVLWIGVGVVAGVIARSGRLVWLAWLDVVAFYPLSLALGLTTHLGPFWFLGALIGAGLVSAGFAIGVPIRAGRDPRERIRSWWRDLGPGWRRLLILLAVLGVVVLVGYALFAVVVGSDTFVNPGTSANCLTPDRRFGWDYEAINYDQRDDLNLAPALVPDKNGRLAWTCPSQGAIAGDDVVTSDGIHVAGWYIPAANGAGPAGPTVVLVHGKASNKSEMLDYAVPLHDRFNLVLLDLRNGGRSTRSISTAGIREQRDVESMIDWLVRTKRPSWIAGLGNSMGAATILAAARSDPRIKALILDSMHARIVVSTGNAIETEFGQPSLPGSWGVVIGASLRAGADLTTVDPVRTITQIGARPVLLSHGSADVVDPPDESAEPNLAAARRAEVPVELHYCPSAGHGKVIEVCSADWGRWATTFLEAAMAR